MHFDKPREINGHLVLGSPVGRDALDPLLRQVSVNSELDEHRRLPRHAQRQLRPHGAVARAERTEPGRALNRPSPARPDPHKPWRP